jgi:glycosyltransferase involved in cell wall biosynthesis
VNFSHKVISDNKEIFKYVLKKYRRSSYLIAYGSQDPIPLKKDDLDRENVLYKEFFLSICRIVPENNIELILKTFSKSSRKIIFIGNWKSDSYSKKLYDQYNSFENITLMLPIYCPKRLNIYRTRCISYIHGHSVGGSNPSLIEIMTYKKPIIAYKCNFNLYTLNNQGLYFNCEQSLSNILRDFYEYNLNEISIKTQNYARNNYTWEIVKEKYIKMLCNSI